MSFVESTSSLIELWSKLRSTAGKLLDPPSMFALIQSWLWCLDVRDVVVGAFVCVVIFLLHNLFFVPMNRVRKLEEVGFRHLNRRKEEVNRARRLKQSGKLPPSFPNGWFVILESRDLAVGEVKKVAALGTNFAVFRGSSGNVFVTSAYCPHLGADMSVAGRVQGDCIQCPFHNWVFEGDSGQCVKIPYAEGKIPAGAAIDTHKCIERNGLIFVWHHEDKEEPSWTPPVLEGIAKGWKYRGRNEFEVNCHIQDIAENGADVNHLHPVHESPILLGGEPIQGEEEYGVKFARHQFQAEWKPGKEAHIAHVTLNHSMRLFNSVNLFTLKLEAEQIGPALVHLHFQSPLGSGVMIQYVLPIEPNLQKFAHVFYTQPAWILPYAKVVLLGESILVERDIRIWNNKKYEDKPLLVKEDKLIGQHRRWYANFYSDNSKQRDTLEW